MKHAAAMGIFHGLGNGDHQLGRFTDIDVVPPNSFLQRAALQVFHRQEMRAFVSAEIIDGNDVRVIHIRRRRCLGVKSMHKITTGCRSANQHFQSNDAVDAELTRFVNDSHAASANFLQQFVVTKVTDTVQIIVEIKGIGGQR